MKKRLLAASVSLALATSAGAVYLNPQGVGQALIYPYYTVRSIDGNAFNTFISVVNHSAFSTNREKVLRVRFREGRNGREVANFNLYLSPNDVWTAAIVPTADGATLLTNDTSCTNPAFNASVLGLRELAFSNEQYSGANADGGPTGLDRTREGYVEILEMGNLSGSAAVAITHQATGTPASCPFVQGATVNLGSISAPSGGLSGTATLINVANGMDFTTNAEALDDVFDAPIYRNYNDAYPDWNATEVRRLSHITANGKQYRLTWDIGVDAVSSVLTRSSVMNEYIRDTNTLSQTDWVFTFPTRRMHVNNFGTAAPFSAPLQAGTVCERILFRYFNREERGDTHSSCLYSSFDNPCVVAQPLLCYASTVLNFAQDTAPASAVFGSVNRGNLGLANPVLPNGWAEARFLGVNAMAGLQSLPSSIARDLTTDQATTGVQAFIGLPVVGFMVRTFVNGTLGCAAGNCQGNYGGLFSHKYRQQTTSP